MHIYENQNFAFGDLTLNINPVPIINKMGKKISVIKDYQNYVEIKCQLDATEVFIADLIVCSTCFGHHYAHHQEFKSIIQWLLRVVFYAVVFQVAGLVWSWGLCVRFEGCWFTLLHLVGILFPHINDDARSKSHQIYQNYVYQFLL